MPSRIGGSTGEPLQWFAHDSHASDDDKIERLTVRDDGSVDFDLYGRWWVLCEALAASSTHELDWSTPRGRKVTCRRLKMDEGECGAFLARCVGVGLIDRRAWGERGAIVSERMLEQAYKTSRRVIANRQNGRKGGRPKGSKNVKPTYGRRVGESAGSSA